MMTKKLVAVMSLLAVVLGPASAFAAPASTTEDIDTSLDVITNTNGGNANPIVKAKWEEEISDTNLESGDPTHATVGSQFNPPLVNGAKKEITVCTVVTDPQGLSTIATVKATVDGPVCAGKTPHWLYELTKAYTPDTQAAAAKARFQSAYDKNLVKYFDGYVYTEIMNELNNGHAAIYCGPFQLDYEDPSGLYNVEVKAQDTLNGTTKKNNQFLYVPMAGVVTDFEDVDYGFVQLLSESMANAGDFNLGPDATTPTVKNIGNTRMTLSINQDNMGLPLDTDIVYAARVGDTTHTKVTYNPNTTTPLLTVFGMSEIQKMDFWVTVRQTGESTHYEGDMVLTANPVDFTETNCTNYGQSYPWSI
jgi:hypothetical protein